MKKFLFLTLTSFLFFSFQTMAQTIVDSGSCGNNEGDCNWILYEGGKLSITGSGAMKSYAKESLPWGNNVNQVDIQGITSIGSLAFRNTKITQINVPNSVSYLQDVAFQAMPELTNVTFEDGGNINIAGAVFMNTPKLSSIKLPNDIDYLGYNNFISSSLQSLVLPDSLFKDDGSIGLSNITFRDDMIVYCSKENLRKCEQYFDTAKAYDGNANYNPIKNITLQTYENTGNGYYADGKFYTNPGDIGTPNYIKKRIYTIDEANKVSGAKNSIKIRYK